MMLKLPLRMMPVVCGEYNRKGYEICIAGRLVYAAGNHVHDSAQCATCDRDQLPLRTIRKFCIKTAREIAEEHNGRFSGVERVSEPPQ